MILATQEQPSGWSGGVERIERGDTGSFGKGCGRRNEGNGGAGLSPHVMSDDHSPHLPGTEDDEQVLPEGRDLGPEVGLLPADLSEMFSSALPGAGAGRHFWAVDK